MKKSAMGLICLLWLAGCAPTPQAAGSTPRPEATPNEPTPSATSLSGSAEAKAVAGAAFQEFGGRLKSELQAAIDSGGPVQAVEVCHTRAPLIAQEVSSQKGIEMGRSSHRTRNSANTPTAAVAAYLEKYAREPADKAPVEVTGEGDYQLVIAPIPTAPLCLTCHGNPDTFSPELKASLAKYYPEDQATWFEVDDLRGVFWAKVKP